MRVVELTRTGGANAFAVASLHHQGGYWFLCPHLHRTLWLAFCWGQLRFICYYHLLCQGHPKGRDAAHGVAPETDGAVAATSPVVAADEYDVVVPDKGHDADVVRHHGNRANPRGGRLAIGCVFAHQIAAARVASLLEDHVEVASTPVVAPSGRVLSIVAHGQSHERVGCIRRVKFGLGASAQRAVVPLGLYWAMLVCLLDYTLAPLRDALRLSLGA